MTVGDSIQTAPNFFYSPDLGEESLSLTVRLPSDAIRSEMQLAHGMERIQPYSADDLTAGGVEYQLPLLRMNQEFLRELMGVRNEQTLPYQRVLNMRGVWNQQISEDRQATQVRLTIHVIIMAVLGVVLVPVALITLFGFLLNLPQVALVSLGVSCLLGFTLTAFSLVYIKQGSIFFNKEQKIRYKRLGLLEDKLMKSFGYFPESKSVSYFCFRDSYVSACISASIPQGPRLRPIGERHLRDRVLQEGERATSVQTVPNLFYNYGVRGERRSFLVLGLDSDQRTRIERENFAGRVQPYTARDLAESRSVKAIACQGLIPEFVAALDAVEGADTFSVDQLRNFVDLCVKQKRVDDKKVALTLLAFFLGTIILELGIPLVVFGVGLFLGFSPHILLLVFLGLAILGALLSLVGSLYMMNRVEEKTGAFSRAHSMLELLQYLVRVHPLVAPHRWRETPDGRSFEAVLQGPGAQVIRS